MIGARLARRIVASARRRIDRARVEVLTYHFVTSRDHAFNRGGHVVRPAVFAEQLAWLRERYELVRLRDIPALRPAARPYAAITFDDGYQDCIEEAYPILERERVPATLFVCPSVLDNRDLLWRDKVRLIIDQKREEKFVAFLASLADRRYRLDDLARSSFYTWSKSPVIDPRIRGDLDDFFAQERLSASALAENAALFMRADDLVPRPYLDYGNHTWSHPIMTLLTAEEQRDEIARADRFLVDRGLAPIALALPFAPYNAATITACAGLGYRLMCTIAPGANRLGLSDELRVVRRRMAPSTIDRLRALL